MENKESCYLKLFFKKTFLVYYFHTRSKKVTLLFSRRVSCPLTKHMNLRYHNDSFIKSFKLACAVFILNIDSGFLYLSLKSEGHFPKPKKSFFLLLLCLLILLLTPKVIIFFANLKTLTSVPSHYNPEVSEANHVLHIYSPHD